MRHKACMVLASEVKGIFVDRGDAQHSGWRLRVGPSRTSHTCVVSGVFGLHAPCCCKHVSGTMLPSLARSAVLSGCWAAALTSSAAAATRGLAVSARLHEWTHAAPIPLGYAMPHPSIRVS